MSTLEAITPGKWGLLAKYDDPIIRFLMDRKFPWLKRMSNAPPPPMILHLRGSKTSIEGGKLTPAAAADVAKYESELHALTEEARQEIFDREAANAAKEHSNAAEIDRQLQEKKLYAQWPAADFTHWLRAALWNADEAIDLSLGKEPDIRFGWNHVSRVLQISEFARAYEKRRLLIYRAIQAGDLPNPMRPERFMRWADTLALSVPKELTLAPAPQATPTVETPAADRSDMPPSSEATIRRKEFIKTHATHVRKGERRLKEFFDGKTRKAGEMTEAEQFRVPGKSGLYYLDRMIEYLRGRGNTPCSIGMRREVSGAGTSEASGKCFGKLKTSRTIDSHRYMRRTTP